MLLEDSKNEMISYISKKLHIFIPVMSFPDFIVNPITDEEADKMLEDLENEV